MAIHTLSTLLPTIQVGVRAHTGLPISKNALIDTGSTITAISPAVRAALKPMALRPVLYHPRGQQPTWVNSYYIISEIEPHKNPGRTFALEVIEEQPVTPGVDILIGYDLLRHVVLFWDGPRSSLVMAY